MTMWDAFQRDVLGAMGHTVLVPVASHGVAPAASPASAAPAVPAVTAAPAAPRAPVADPATQPALLHALARAAGLDDPRRDLGHRIALPPLAELRTPVAKRRLWPRLRALRKTPPA